MEKLFLKNVIKVGNSAGVLVPKEWLDGKAKVELVEEPINIQKDVIEILHNFLDDVIAIYLVGSYARGEQDEKSDIDILVISNEKKEEIHSGKYNISICPLKNIKKTLVKNPLMILPRIKEAKPIMNKNFLEILQYPKPTKKQFNEFFKSSKRILKINQELIQEGKIDGNIIYSLFLRLRGFFLIKCLLNVKDYSNNNFKKYLISKNINYKEMHKIYSYIKLNKVYKKEISLEEVNKLLFLLELEIKKWQTEKRE